MHNTRHTPLPWGTKPGNRYEIIGLAENTPAVKVASTYESNAANAELIIRAVNNHAALVESLSALADAAENRENVLGDPCSLLNAKAKLAEAAKAARAAIAAVAETITANPEQDDYKKRAVRYFAEAAEAEAKAADCARRNLPESTDAYHRAAIFARQCGYQCLTDGAVAKG